MCVCVYANECVRNGCERASLLRCCGINYACGTIGKQATQEWWIICYSCGNVRVFCFLFFIFIFLYFSVLVSNKNFVVWLLLYVRHILRNFFSQKIAATKGWNYIIFTSGSVQKIFLILYVCILKYTCLYIFQGAFRIQMLHNQ